uniref:Putative DNA polymerase n=1 Tax=viral metagenome TaxID=1070528 RepID=A0A6M3KIG3_9ZZZZ
MMLYLKYNLKSIEDLLGNKHIVNSLTQMFLNSSYSHLLFEGELGCGKSTLAEVVARKYGADEYNIMTINCFNEGVSDIRTVIDRFIYSSSIFGIRKALILDEIHGLSPQAQQILNKVLDDKNLIDRVIVIICTTTIAKVYPALISRFQHYRVFPLSDEDSRILIDRVLENENIKLSKYAKHMIIEKCGGIPRNILTAIPKLVNIEEKQEIDLLLDLLSMDESGDNLDLFKAMFTRGTSWEIIKSKLEKLLKQKSPESIRVGLMNLISGKLMSRFIKGELEGWALVEAYKVLKSAYGFPEKAGVVSGIFDAYRVYNYMNRVNGGKDGENR